jgi:hypothetical protein
MKSVLVDLAGVALLAVIATAGWWLPLFSASELIQGIGAAFILAGYWTMARAPRRVSSGLLVVGCAVWAFWAWFFVPDGLFLLALELILGAMSLRTFWINRKERT